MVNDAAERSIALFQEYRGLTKDHDEQEYVMQVIEKSRKEYTNLSKESIVNKLRQLIE